MTTRQPPPDPDPQNRPWRPAAAEALTLVVEHAAPDVVAASFDRLITEQWHGNGSQIMLAWVDTALGAHGIEDIGPEASGRFRRRFARTVRTTEAAALAALTWSDQMIQARLVDDETLWCRLVEHLNTLDARTRTRHVWILLACCGTTVTTSRRRAAAVHN